MSWITVKAANFNMPCLELEIEFILTTFLSHEIFFLETFIVSSFYSNKISTIFKMIINLKATCLTTITIKKHKLYQVNHVQNRRLHLANVNLIIENQIN